VVAADYVPVAPDKIKERVMRQVKDGSVVLLHDSPDTAAALPGIIRELRARGYGFVTASQMLARLPRPVYVATNAYAVKPLPAKNLPPPVRVVRQKAAVRPKSAASPGSVSGGEAPRTPQDVPVWDGGSEGPERLHDESSAPVS